METKEKQKPVTYVSGLGYLPATPKLTERRNLAMRYHLVILSTMLVLGLCWFCCLPSGYWRLILDSLPGKGN